MEQTLRIDEEFRSKIPPLTEDEFEQLEENILEDGEIREPIVIWNGTIIDGHNRWKIIQKHPEIPYKTKEMNFADKWEAFNWMYKNQLGRRNLTEEQKTLLTGKLYKARKHTVGAQTCNTNAAKRLAQNAPIEKFNSTAEALAHELGINHATVKRAEQFADGIDVIRAEDPRLADDILSGKTSITKKEVRDIRKAEPEEAKKKVEDMKERANRPRQKPKPKMSEEERQWMDNMQKNIDASRVVPSAHVATSEECAKTIKDNIRPYIDMLNDHIERYMEAIKLNSTPVIEAIEECINEFIKMKERIENV